MKIDTSPHHFRASFRGSIEACNSIAAFLALFLISHAASCTDIAPASQIARVEGGMLPRASIKERLGSVETIEQRMEALGIPGVSIAVIDEGRVAWTKAYGVADTVDMTPLTTHTLFQAASISKPIAALGALRLIKEGRLSLNGDVNSQLRSWKIPAAEQIGTRPVTVRQLLSHTAGLSVRGFRRLQHRFSSPERGGSSQWDCSSKLASGAD
jgi:CubicO group peptidase (beta-lactamase class C family)